ncbi:MAG TPA: hypothetical protein VG406_09085 [Isosphaeraceae bacterium]|nr:hypothetical protein [Isosphaeraceae bacterium]
MRAVIAWKRGRDAEAIEEAGEAIEKDGWKSNDAVYSALIGRVAARRAGKDEEAKRFLDEAKARGKAGWPAPIVAFFRGDLDADGLLAAAKDVDEQTEAHGFLGLDLALRGKTDEAIEQLRWVERQGSPASVQYGMALVELERLSRVPKTADARKP